MACQTWRDDDEYVKYVRLKPGRAVSAIPECGGLDSAFKIMASPLHFCTNQKTTYNMLIHEL